MAKGPSVKEPIVEFTGTFIIVFVTCWSYTVLADKKPDYMALALANGLVLAACVWAAFNVSGAHFNPVITIVNLFIRNMPLGQAVLYLFSQLTASFLAAVLAILVLPKSALVDEDSSFGYPETKNITDFQAFIVEFVLSMFYVFAYSATVIDKRAPSNVFGFALGSVVMVGALTVGPYTGGVVNPIRIFGPYLVNGKFDNMVVYWLATFAGGLFAGFYYDYFLLKDDNYEEEENAKSGNAKWSKDDIREANELKY